jgi:hypothetical protein
LLILTRQFGDQAEPLSFLPLARGVVLSIWDIAIILFAVGRKSERVTV